MIQQVAARKSCIVPLGYKSEYYIEDKKHYPDAIVSRKDGRFFNFVQENGSIGFKAVNYRPNLYNGEHHTLEGSTFKTSTEKEYYHTESIDSAVYILLEVNNLYYQFVANELGFVKLRASLKTQK